MNNQKNKNIDAHIFLWTLNCIALPPALPTPPFTYYEGSKVCLGHSDSSDNILSWCYRWTHHCTGIILWVNVVSCAVSDLPQQVGRDKPDEDPGPRGSLCEEIQKKTQTRNSVVCRVADVLSDYCNYNLCTDNVFYLKHFI